MCTWAAGQKHRATQIEPDCSSLQYDVEAAMGGNDTVMAKEDSEGKAIKVPTIFDFYTEVSPRDTAPRFVFQFIKTSSF